MGVRGHNEEGFSCRVAMDFRCTLEPCGVAFTSRVEEMRDGVYCRMC